MSVTNCPNCGANLTRTVCEYCGTLGIPHPNIEQQKQALEVFHSIVTSKSETEQIGFIRQAFLPDDPDVLIEAFLRSIQMLPDGDNPHIEAILGRLRAIIMKLELQPSTPKIKQALEKFEKELAAHKKRSTSDILWGIALIIGLPALLIGLGLYLWLG